ncbi:MAG: histidinol-phosphate transaminase [Opitutaceae bacterium]
MKKTFDASLRALPHVQKLHAYVPGEQPQGEGWVKLNTNENPYPPSPKVAEAVEVEAAQLRKYPEPVSRQLRDALGEHFGLSGKQVIIGNGSDNILDLITRCFVDSAGAAHTVPSYSLYPVVAGMSDKGLVDIPFTRAMSLDVDAIAASKASVIFLTSPNAPTGVPFSRAEIGTVLERIDGLLVVDEAYVDFGGETAVPLLQDYQNLIVVRTFSKSYGLAGMRVGFALADAGIVGMLDRVRDAYNLDRIAQAAALAALQDTAYFKEQCAKVVATREETRLALDGLGWFTYPSAANLLFTEPKNTKGEAGAGVAAELFEHLKQSKVLVRYFPKHPLTCAFIRVSIGTDVEMKAFLTAVNSWLNHA